MKLISPIHKKSGLSQKFYSAQLSRKEARRLQEKERIVVTESTFQGKSGLWEMRIGLEVHAQVQTDLKMFSGKFYINKEFFNQMNYLFILSDRIIFILYRFLYQTSKSSK